MRENYFQEYFEENLNFFAFTSCLWSEINLISNETVNLTKNKTSPSIKILATRNFASSLFGKRL